MRAVTGRPITFVGGGEKRAALDTFDPRRVADRILGMGDVVSLGEKAAETMEQDAAERLAANMSKGQFDMEDLRSQLRQMRNMGGIGALASMIPGLAKAKAAMANNGPDDRLLLRMEAMVGSMTPKERRSEEHTSELQSLMRI